MALEGTLKDFPLPDIIQLLSLSRKTGAVEIVGTDGFGTGRLYFHQGKVVSAALDDLLAPDAAFAFFTFPGGSFRFYENEPPASQAAPITISNEFLIIEGIRRADEWEKLRDRIPSLDLILGLVADPVAGNRDINLKPDEWRVLTMINGRDSVRTIARRTTFGDFKTARIVYHLLTSGLIEPLGMDRLPATTRAGAPPSAPERDSAPAPPPGPRPSGSSVIRPLGPVLAPTATVPTAPPVAVPPTSVVRPLTPAVNGSNGSAPKSPAVAVPSVAAVPAARTGASLYARLEAIAMGELGNTGRLMLSNAYKQLRLQPGADLAAGTAGSLCDQFERGASMLVGTGRARALAETLRRATSEFFSG